MASTLLDRFEAKVGLDDIEGCWPWQGTIREKDGYGVFAVTATEQVYAHRYAWELFVGPIPDGEWVDHVCHDPLTCEGGSTCPHRQCVNPDHLQPGPPVDNMADDRAHNGNREKTHCPDGHPSCRICKRLDPGNVANGDKTECKHGHEFTEENTIIMSNGYRRCRECVEIYNQSRRISRQKGEV